MKILFIANPTSEKIEKKEIEEIISGYSGQYNFSWQTYFTEKKGNIEKIENKITEFNPGLVIAIGGDGTINLVGMVLLNKKNIEMGIIPAGSANGLAYNLNMPGNFREALQQILEAKAKPFDAIRINQNYLCLHLADVGINAQTVKRFEKERSKGIMGYGKHMLKEFWKRKRAFSFYLLARGHIKKYTAEMLVLANAKAYGTGATINQDGKTDDGKFEIIIIKPYPWWSLFRLIGLLFIAKHHHVDFVKVISTSKADIQFSKPQDLQADGEMIESISAIKAEILPSALKIRY
ncbi:MAG: diacylglycerol kinase family protein [Bacteroidales bacterium]